MTDDKTDMGIWDKEDIFNRLIIAQETLRKEFDPTSGEKTSILRKRAQELASDPVQAVPGDHLLTIVNFTMGNETYGIDLKYTRKVIFCNDLTPVPCTPPFVKGIINFRGQILSIIDLTVFFGFCSETDSRNGRVIVLTSDTMEFGIWVRDIVGVQQIDAGTLHGIPLNVTGIRARYVKGVTQDQVILLDGEKLLTDGQVIVREEVEQRSL